jgi:ribonucleoside-diphosphate reductase alpha chain
MGWAEMLIQMDIPYDSPEALELAEKVMGFIDREAHNASKALAVVRGNFPLFDKYKKRYSAMRNAVLTTAAPTGSRAIIASTSSGIEPLFAIGQTRITADGLRLMDVNKHFVAKAEELGIWNESLKAMISTKGKLDGFEAEGITIPKKFRSLFKTAHEIPPMQHVLMQAAFQKHIGSSVSKTVNLPHSATIEDVKDVFLKSNYHGCKGITVYRDGCREGQTLTLGCEICEL